MSSSSSPRPRSGAAPPATGILHTLTAVGAGLFVLLLLTATLGWMGALGPDAALVAPGEGEEAPLSAEEVAAQRAGALVVVDERREEGRGPPNDLGAAADDDAADDDAADDDAAGDDAADDEAAAAADTSANPPPDEDRFLDFCRGVARRATTLPAPNATVILVYASTSYTEPLMNWLAALRAVDRRHRTELLARVALVCLDPALAAALAQAGFACFALRDDARAAEQRLSTRAESSSLSLGAVASLWVVRMQHVVRLLGAGISVVVSDTDAVWVRNPFALKEFRLGEIVGGRGFFPYQPPWGASLCMGVVQLRAVAGVLEVARLAAAHTAKALDDQVGFDKAFRDVEASSRKATFPKRLQVRGTRSVTGLLGGKVSLVLASHEVIPRDCSAVSEDAWRSKVAVAHCHTHDGVPAATMKEKGNPVSHTEVLRRFHVYVLCADWARRLAQLRLSRGVGGVEGAASPPQARFIRYLDQCFVEPSEGPFAA